jgi:DNA repair protein RecO (recombination protein O)
VGGRTEHADAILLRSVDYGESDRIVTLLSATHGKIGLMARGARASRRRYASALEPFALIHVGLVPGRTGLGTLTEAQLRRGFTRVIANLERMRVAGAALELVRNLVPDAEPDAAVFATVVAMLDTLDREEVDPTALLALFDARMMTLGGFAPRLDACGGCGKQPRATQPARFDPRAGHIVCRDCGSAPEQLDGEARTQLARTLGPDWAAGADGTWNERSRDGALRAMRSFAEHRLGKALRSLDRSSSSARPGSNRPPAVSR